MNNKQQEDQAMVEQALRRYTTGNLPQFTFLGGLQNQVYEYKHGERNLVLRLTPLTNRSELMVQGELDWILFLADKGISLSKPIPSIQGKRTEVVNSMEGGAICVVFEKAAGRKVGYPECLEDDGLYERLGRLTGKMHALSSRYVPSKHQLKRHEWHQNWFLQHLDLMPQSHVKARRQCSTLISEIGSLPKDAHSYGLIHGDINVGNFRVSEQDEITLFDFDEAQYSWYVEDIAVQLYYLVYVYGGEQGAERRAQQARRFMDHFMKGYREEHHLDEYWIRKLPLFLKLREIIVYIGSFRNWDGDETFSSSDNQWFKDWMAESRARIENGISIVDIWS